MPEQDEILQPDGAEDFAAPETGKQESNEKTIESMASYNELTENEKQELNRFLELQKEAIYWRADTLSEIVLDNIFELVDNYNQEYCGTNGAAGHLGGWLSEHINGPGKERRRKAMEDAGLSFDNFKRIDRKEIQDLKDLHGIK